MKLVINKFSIAELFRHTTLSSDTISPLFLFDSHYYYYIYIHNMKGH